MKKNRLIDIIKEFKNRRIAIVGDIALDRYLWAVPKSENPESDAPIYIALKEDYRLGCAGNVAANISSLGAESLLFGIIGEDQEADIIKNCCLESRINIGFFNEGRTIIKERIMGLHHKTYIQRIDRNDRSPIMEFDIPVISEEAEEFLYSKISLSKPDCIVLSDYNKRVFRGGLAKRVIKFANSQGITTIVDPKQQNIDSFKGATLIKPNKREAQKITGDFSENLVPILRKLKSLIRTKYSVITSGEEGMFILDKKPYNIHAHTRDVYDVSGAGDTVSAALALSLSSKASLLQAAHIANYAAGIVVEKQGTATLSERELIHRIKKTTRHHGLKAVV